MTTWTDAQLSSIDKMLNPRSIAVVGASPRMQYGGRMLAAALKAKDRVVTCMYVSHAHYRCIDYPRAR